MKTTMRLFVFIVIACCFSSILQSQDIHKEKFILSVQAGPSWYVGDLTGITDNTSKYMDKLRKGVTWNGAFTYLFGRSAIKGGVGLIYQGNRYTNDKATSSDEINMNYIGPRMSLFYMKKKFSVHCALGPGYMIYRDYSIVYNKPRNVHFNQIAFHAAIGGEYLLIPQLGIAVQASWTGTETSHYNVNYHDKEWLVTPSQAGGDTISTLSLSAGINYHF